MPRRHSVEKRMINEYGTVGGVRIGRVNWNTCRKPAPVPPCLHQIPNYLIWDRTRTTAKFWPGDRIIQDSKLKGGKRCPKTILPHNLFRDAILFWYNLPRKWTLIIFRKMYKYLYFIIIINSKESEDMSLQIKHQNIETELQQWRHFGGDDPFTQVTRSRDDVKITQMANVTQSALQ